MSWATHTMSNPRKRKRPPFDINWKPNHESSRNDLQTICDVTFAEELRNPLFCTAEEAEQDRWDTWNLGFIIRRRSILFKRSRRYLSWCIAWDTNHDVALLLIENAILNWVAIQLGLRARASSSR
jgi:hypothetical protein